MKQYKLRELIDVTRGASLSGDYFETEGKLVRLTCGNFDYNNNRFKQNTSKDNIYYSGAIRSEFIMEKGDIITPLTEQAIGLLGSTARIPESGKYIQSQDIAKIICKEGMLDKDFAYYLISSKLVKDQLSAAAQQTKIRHTSPDKIKDCTVWVPNLDSQKLIGQVLSTIDCKISINIQINQNLEAMAKKLYDYWFVQFDFPDQNGRPYKSSGGKMVWNAILKREIPEGWGVKKLGDISQIVNGATPSTDNDDNYGGNIKWITPKDLSDQKCKFVSSGERNLTKIGYDSCSTTIVPQGSILMSSRAPIGLVSIATNEVCTNQGFKTIVPNDIENSFFLYYYILQYMKKIEQLGTGTTFKEVSRDSLMKFDILCCENKSLHSRWLNIIKPIFKQQQQVVEQINDLTALRDELLPLLMNGQVSFKQLNSDLSND